MFVKMDKINQIGFCFENLETIFVPVSCVKALEFRGIHQNMSLTRDGTLHSMVCSDEAFVVLEPEAEKKAISLFDMYDRESCSACDSLFKRLESDNDCCGIELYPDASYFSEDSVEIYVPWQDKGDDYTTNVFQKGFVEKRDDYNWKGFFCVHFGPVWSVVPEPDGGERVKD